jgi:hypothetical protein
VTLLRTMSAAMLATNSATSLNSSLPSGRALTGTGELLDQCAQIRWFELFEPAGTIFRGIAPRIRIGADERAHG